jgi:hypothetical protein
MNRQIPHASVSLGVRSLVLLAVILFYASLSPGQSGPTRPQAGVNPSLDVGQPIAEPSPRAPENN